LLFEKTTGVDAYSIPVFIILNMKKIIKSIFTLKHPVGDVWATGIFALILLSMGLINFDTAYELFISAALLLMFVAVVSLVNLFLKRYK
jgi:hypothetical protein